MHFAIVLAVILPLSFILWVISVCVHSLSSRGSMDVWSPISPWRWLFAILLPILITRSAFQKRSLNRSGAIIGLFVGFVMTLTNYCFFAALLAFFLSGSKATKFRQDKKKKLEADFKEGGQRNWVQVLCNGGIATEIAIIHLIEHGTGEFPINFSRLYLSSWQAMAVLGALACSCGDTWASEIGNVVDFGQPRLITSFSTVPKGTNGGVTLVGTLASALGGATVGLAYYMALVLMLSESQLYNCPPQWPIVLVGAAAGLIGSAIDSILGAMFQYSGYCKTKQCIVEYPGDDVEYISGSPIFDNHSINLLSGLITAKAKANHDTFNLR
ncbi:unnamed protein product [Owenia fusiformis]|uniref:Transmembrane protein 19 n=1 Tax=Owenia fusiformis TaxID=6347 RepID=A0A8J1UKW2_OWEFU|nr:unnamed protein product [Owenia fusiformis]